MRIGLYGIYGLYNFGCEAIVRGTYKFIKNIYPECNIVYYSRCYEYDKKMLKDLDIEINEVKVKRNLIEKVLNKGFYLLKIPFVFLGLNDKEMFQGIDAFFFIGGDIITIPSVYRERKRYRYVNELVEFGRIAKSRKIPVVLYGASVGPFGNYSKAIDYYKRNLKSYKYIICREYDSIEYLKLLGLENVYFSPDPAFLVTGTGNTNETKKYIGINLSPLSLKEVYGDINETHINEMGVIIERIYNQYQYEILLLPHVISKEESDDDLRFQQMLYNSLEDEIKRHVYIADYKNGFLGIKEQVKECCVVITARMHCAINALHESIPTIFLAYSQKSVGMCKYVYGNDTWVIALKSMKEELEPRLNLMMSEIDLIEKQLVKRNSEIQEYYKSQIDNLNID